MQFRIRWMIRQDMSEVLDIESRSFEQPWSESDFVRCLRGRNVIGRVCEVDGMVVGFMVYELHKERIEIINFAVHPDWRYQGIGRTMLRKLIGKLSFIRRTTLAANVCEHNLDGHLFLRACGLTCIGIERNVYDDGQDAYRFEHRHAAELVTSRV